MITHDDAERIATDILGAPGPVEDPDWRLVEFDSGWLIKKKSQGRRGGVTRVIERSSGEVLEFPSSISSRRILDDFAAVADRGRVNKDARGGG